MTTIDDSGLTLTTRDQRLENLKTALQAIYGTDIEVANTSPDGQLLAVYADALSDMDLIVKAVYESRSPRTARGAALSRLALLNGVVRKGPQFSTVPIALTGAAGTVVPAGSLIASDEAGSAVTFQVTTDVTIGSVGAASGQARATVAGPVTVATGHLTVIQTVISGWTGVTNPTDATPGTLIETDAQLRPRRLASVAMPSQGILDGLAAGLAQLPNVIRVRLYENPSGSTIALPGGTLVAHGIQAIVDGGDPVDIARAIWIKKSLGVTMVGAQSHDIVDVQGFTHTMRWDRPVDLDVFVGVQLAEDVDTTTKNAIIDSFVSWGNANARIGGDVVWSQLFGPINDVATVNVTAIFLGGSPSPTLQASLVCPFNAVARWNAAHISVGT